MVRRILSGQLLITLVGMALAAAFGDGRSALAAAAGGGMSWLLTWYVAFKLFAARGERDAGRIFGALVRAEVMKLVLAAVLISLAVMAFEERLIPLVVTLSATLGAYWLALIRTDDD